MQLTIIGAGAIGGTIGAHMIRAGHDILFCDTDAEHVAAINARGLHIEGPVEDFTVAARAVTPDQLPDRIANAAISVKSHHTADAAALVAGRLDPEGFLVSFQNGMTSDTLAAAVGRERLILGFVNFGADLLAPGRIMQGNVATFRVGEPDGGPITDRVRALADALPYAQATGNIMGYLWGKEAYSAMLCAGAVSDLPIADTLSDPRFRRLMIAIAREVLAQAPVTPEGFDGLEPDDLEGSLDRLAAFNRASAKTHSGTYRDLMVHRRKTSVRDMLGLLDGPLVKYTVEMIGAIERGERTCEVANLELLATLERAERLGRPLDAIVDIVPAPPRAPAGPLHGVAIAVKDLVDVAGLPRGNGNPHDMAGPPSAEDAPIVASLRSLGADVFATTALLEYAAGATNPDVPETMNPYDLTKTAGGSSGGSGALVGAGVCDVALGTDTGGSIRLPAHYCATVGFKPTFGALDATGVQALAPSLDHVGLLAKDVAITTRVFSALRDEDPEPAPETLTIGIDPGHLDSPAVTAEVARSVRDAVSRLGAAGCTIVEIDPAARQACEDLAGTLEGILSWEAWAVHGERVRSDPDHYGPDTLRLLKGSESATEAGYRAALARREELLPAAMAAYDGVDVLLSPAGPYAAPSTTPPMDTPDGEAEGLFTGLHNVSGAPAIVLPAGWSDDALPLPLGIQLSSPAGTDMRLLAAAALVERLLAVEPRELDPALRG